MNNRYITPSSDDNSLLIDSRIEHVLDCIVKDDPSIEFLDQFFNEAVVEYLTDSIPGNILFSKMLGQDSPTGYAISLCLMFYLDCLIVNKGSKDWPEEGFPFMKNARYCVGLHCPQTGLYTSYFPGRHLNQALLGAFAQYLREVSTIKINTAGHSIN